MNGAGIQYNASCTPGGGGGGTSPNARTVVHGPGIELEA